MIVDALKKHIDCAEAVLAGEASFLEEEPPISALDLKGIDIVCKEGVSIAFCEKVKNWLKGKPGRRLFFIEDQVPRLKAFALHPHAVSLLNDPRIKIFFLESPIQKDAVAKKIGWLSAFKELRVIGDSWAPLIESYHLSAHAIASDAADFGVGVFRHLKINQQRSLHNLASLKNCLKGIPAVICGAGPSLEKNGHLLAEWKGKALLIAAGSAIHSMKTTPDLAIAFDPHIPLVRRRYFDVPLCMQSRVHPDSLTNITGKLLYFPESHFAFDGWIMGSAESFDSGWTAGTAGVAIAAHLGCSPIVLIGMDYCYQGEQKYAGQKKRACETPLVSAKDGKGTVVWTQRDWLMAISWLEKFAASHPEISCLKATNDGMAIAGFEASEFNPPSPKDIEFAQIFKSAALLPTCTQRLQQWQESLKRCLRTDFTESMPDEIAHELLLKLLWQIWAPLFERELMADEQPISLQEKMALQKFLFFNQVIEEHLNVE